MHSVSEAEQCVFSSSYPELQLLITIFDAKSVFYVARLTLFMKAVLPVSKGMTVLQVDPLRNI